jgi:U3 small nucleolar RNA-associated protein 16
MVSSGEGQDAASLPVRAKDDEPTQNLPTGKGNITVFGESDDEGASAPAPAPAKAQPSKVEETEEEDSDDDEAPEAVSTQAAASIAKKSSQTAQRAAQE